MKKIMAATGIICALVLTTACEQHSSNGDNSPTIATTLPDRGANWIALQGIGSPSNAFTVSAILEKKYKVGDALQFKIRSARDGYLHIVQVDSKDSVSTLLPHAAFGDNKVAAGQEFAYPPAGSNIKVRAQEPLGDSLLAFVVTKENIPTQQLLPELFAKEGARGLTVITDDAAATGNGTAPWSLAKYTVNVTAGDK